MFHQLAQKSNANEQDIEDGFKLWDEIAESQDRNLPPYIYNLYNEVILPTYIEKNAGLTRQEIMAKHYKVHGQAIADWKLRQEVIPMLETAGLIKQEQDIDDRRNKLVYPLSELTISEEEEIEEEVEEKVYEEYDFWSIVIIWHLNLQEI